MVADVMVVRVDLAQLTVWTTLALRGQNTRAIGGKDRTLCSIQCISKSGLVVISGKDRSHIPCYNNPSLVSFSKIGFLETSKTYP